MKNNFQIEHKMKAAFDFEMEGKLLHSLQVYRQIIDDQPAYEEAYFRIADIYEKLNNIEPAIKLFNEFLLTEPENRKIRLFYGQYLLKNSLWNEAVEIMSYLLPEEEPIVTFFLGYSYFMMKEYELSKINFIKFTEFKEQTDLLYEAYLYLSKIEINLNNYESALSYSKKVQSIYSDFWEFNLVTSIIYYNLGMFEHAIVPIEKALRSNPKENSLFEWAGKIYLKSGDYLKAEKKFLKYIELFEEASSDTYTKLAEACLKSKKAKAALNYYEMALKLDPSNYAAVEGKKNASFIIDNMAQDG